MNQPSSLSLEKLLKTAAESLLGLTLVDGWKVVKKIEPSPTSTGGNFCVQYHVQSPDGRTAFCKALDLSMANDMDDPARWVQFLVEGFNFERDLLGRCRSQKLSRIVVALTDGVVKVPGEGAASGNVNYIIFEMADFDIRAALDLAEGVSVAAKLRALHHVASGVRQLHGIGVAHQDIKPSNVLLFSTWDKSGREGKLADLGRASDASRIGPHDHLSVAGDSTYAPPEQSYRSTPSSFYERRIACDLYQLGSLAAFIFTGASMNSLLHAALAPAHNWSNWGDSYIQVLPYVRDAFGRALRRVEESTPEIIRADLRRLIESLCDPEPARRGDGFRSANGQQSLERIVSVLNLLRTRVETGWVKAKP
jgi:serine/threonine protein kinase